MWNFCSFSIFLIQPEPKILQGRRKNILCRLPRYQHLSSGWKKSWGFPFLTEPTNEVCDILRKVISCHSAYRVSEEYDEYVCTMNLDQDELGAFLSGYTKACPYYRFYDEYKSVQKQN